MGIEPCWSRLLLGLILNREYQSAMLIPRGEPIAAITITQGTEGVTGQRAV